MKAGRTVRLVALSHTHGPRVSIELARGHILPHSGPRIRYSVAPRASGRVHRIDRDTPRYRLALDTILIPFTRW